MVKQYSFKQYMSFYQRLKQENVLLENQSPRMNELEFLDTKKQLLDLFTVPDRTDRIARRRGMLVNKLCLNGYQQYRYEDYYYRYKLAMNAKRISGHQLSPTEFVPLKKQLLILLARKKPAQTKRSAVMLSEAKLRAQLFPPVPVGW